MAYEYYVGCIENIGIGDDEDLIRILKDHLSFEVKDFHVVGFHLICNSSTTIELSDCSIIKSIPIVGDAHEIKLDNEVVWIDRMKFISSTRILAMNFFFEGIKIEEETKGDDGGK